MICVCKDCRCSSQPLSTHSWRLHTSCSPMMTLHTILKLNLLILTKWYCSILDLKDLIFYIHHIIILFDLFCLQGMPDKENLNNNSPGSSSKHLNKVCFKLLSLKSFISSVRPHVHSSVQNHDHLRSVCHHHLLTLILKVYDFHSSAGHKSLAKCLECCRAPESTIKGQKTCVYLIMKSVSQS